MSGRSSSEPRVSFEPGVRSGARDRQVANAPCAARDRPFARGVDQLGEELKLLVVNKEFRERLVESGRGGD